jgi:hypothetical protein
MPKNGWSVISLATSVTDSSWTSARTTTNTSAIRTISNRDSVGAAWRSTRRGIRFRLREVSSTHTILRVVRERPLGPTGGILRSGSQSPRGLLQQGVLRSLRRIGQGAGSAHDLLEQVDDPRIDFATMDIELAEPKALAGFDIVRYRPRLVCVEAHPEIRQQLLNYFADRSRPLPQSRSRQSMVRAF